MAVSKESRLRLSLTARLLIAAILLFSALAGVRQVIYYWAHGPAVTDLRIFLTGVEMVRSGQGRQLYSFDAQQKTQVRLFPDVKRAGLLPFNHLAFELLFYVPISGLPYRTALIAWACVNLILVFAVAHLLKPYTQAVRDATGIPVIFYFVSFYPLLYVFGEGQDSLIFLFLVVLSWHYSEKKLWFLSGFVLALALFKFHLALAIAFFVFLVHRRWRTVGGFAAGGILVFGISRLIAGPGFPADYISMLRNQETMTPWGFAPWLMPNLRGLLQWWLARWLDIGAILPIILIVSLVAATLTAWILLRSRSHEQTAVVYSVAASATILISYHLHMQDLSLALVPVLLLLDHCFRRQLSRLAVATVVAAASILYLYRIAAVIAPILLGLGCLLALPILLLWLASMSALSMSEAREQSLENSSRSQAMS